MAGQAFQTPVDIANRALQRVGARRITAFSDNTKNAKEVSFCYDKLRRAELRRNLWTFSIRRVFLRPVGTALQPYSATATYSQNALVSFNNVNYISLSNANTGNEPDTSPGSWSVYLQSTSLQVAFPTFNIGTNYSQGQVVVGSDGRFYLYAASAASTGNDPTTTTGFWIEYFGTYVATQFDSTQGYGVGELVYYTTTTNVYANTINGNTNDPTAANSGWIQLVGATTAPVFVAWPADTGPSTQPNTRNVYILPAGYLRRAPQSPEAGRTSWLGFPGNIPATDWTFEGSYLITIQTGALMFRFAADVIDVTKMDDLFCEGLGSRVALEVCEPLTQSTSKLKDIASEYKQFMGEARNVNGIEQGSTEPPLDDYIQTRF